MNNRISFYQQRNTEFLQQISETRNTAAGRTGSAESAAAVKETPTDSITLSGTALSQEEESMIQRYFPTSTNMSLRLYGPDRNKVTVQPAAVGSRLDIQG